MKPAPSLNGGKGMLCGEINWTGLGGEHTVRYRRLDGYMFERRKVDAQEAEKSFYNCLAELRADLRASASLW